MSNAKDRMGSLVKRFGIGVLFSLGAYLCFVIFAERGSPLSWIIPVGIAFYFYFSWFFGGKRMNDIRIIFISGVLFRLLFLFHTPVLSDDYARFIWDGKINKEGQVSVYQSTPSELIHSGSTELQKEKSLYARLNSPDYYSVYPPGSQVVFTLSVLSGRSLAGSLMIMRTCIWVAEIAIFFLLLQLLKRLKKSSSNVGKYFLNPLIIVEWTASLHFEGIMMAFLLAALWYAVRNKLFSSVLSWFGAVAVKLIPLLFIPVLWKKFSFPKTLIFGISVILLLVISFFPFLSFETGNGFFSSLNLYFQRFEFNGSIYLFLREPLSRGLGYNPNFFLAPLLTVSCLLLFVFIFFRIKRDEWKDIIELMVLLWMLWYFFSPVVHPWYITPLIVLACLTDKRSIYLWSALIFISYLFYKDSSWWMIILIAVLQYIPVYILFTREYLQKKSEKQGMVLSS